MKCKKALNASGFQMHSCKNQYIVIIRLTGILKIVAMIQGMHIRVIKAMTILHEIKEINILYTQSVLADCLNH